MQLFAPAKINLSFKILRRREDGFHEIDGGITTGPAKMVRLSLRPMEVQILAK